MTKFKGTGVALVTPFQNKQIDFPALEKIIEHVINGGVDFIVSLGSTGEPINLDRNECQAVLKFTLEKTRGRVPLVAGHFGGNNTAQLIERLNGYDLTGFDAIMSSSPSYVKPTQEGIFQHYMKLAEASPLPIIIYNVPARTGSNMKPETIVRLANANHKFIAVKEAGGDLVQMQEILRLRPNGFTVLSGDDPTALASIGCGCEGVISVIANALPRQFSDMVKAARSGDFKTAQKINLKTYGFHNLLYADGNPAGIKACLNIMGFCKNELRLPLTPVSEGVYMELKKKLEMI